VRFVPQMEQNNFTYIYTTINDWIKFSDTKAGFILASNGIMMGLVGSTLKDLILPRFGFTDWSHILFSIDILLYILSVLISATLAICVIYPKLSVNEASSHIYFAHIAKAKAPTYKSELLQLSNENFDKEIIDQIFAVSKVCWSKYKRTNYSIRALYGSIFFGITVIVLCLFIDP